MNSRMDKYYKDELVEESRSNKNKNAYDKIKNEEIEDLSLTTNISIIDADTTNLNIEDLKKILDERYAKKEEKTSDSAKKEDESDEESFGDTKEYDLNKILDAAHKNKEQNYDEDRFKRVRDTQYDILNSLDLSRTEEPKLEETMSIEDTDLVKAMNADIDTSSNTEQISEEETSQSDEDEILEELVGVDDVDSIEGISSVYNEDDDGKKPTLLEELEKTKQISKENISKLVKEAEESGLYDVSSEEGEKTREQRALRDDFYTGKFQIKDSDLDDFADLKKELSAGNIIIKILIMILVLIILAATVYILNKYLNLGLF